jgi:hypothetical protein
MEHISSRLLLRLALKTLNILMHYFLSMSASALADIERNG